MDESTSDAAAKPLPRILCVDDEPMVLKSLAASLKRHFEVITSSGPLAALELLEQDPDVCAIVSDYRMPGMDGGALLRCVRDRFPTVARILLSGAGAENDGVINEAGTVFRFLAKPCRRENLIATLEEALVVRAELAAAAERS